jgi:hypothetical protein
MKKNFFYVLLLSVLLASCSTKDALKLNDAIVKANDDLRTASEIFGTKFKAVTDYNYATLELERQNMVNLIEKKISDIGAMKASMSGGEDFKNSFIEYYKFEKDIYTNEYKDICLLTGAEGDGEKLNGIITRMQSKGVKEDMMEKSIHTEQQNFARKNNLKLQSNP